MDDILVFSDTFDQHIQHLGEVMKVLNDHRFTVSPPLCYIAQSSMDYIGHTISIDGVTPLKGNIAPIINMPEPRSLKGANLLI